MLILWICLKDNVCLWEGLFEKLSKKNTAEMETILGFESLKNEKSCFSFT